MAPLIQRTWPGTGFGVQTVTLPQDLVDGNFDYQGSLFSAWRWVELAQPQPAYLKPDPGMVQRFRKAWAEQGWKLNVGISWRSRSAASGSARTLSTDALAALVQNPAITFHSLQYGVDATEIAALSSSVGRPIYMDSGGDPLANLDRQAAQIAALDLVVSIDNATVHLAGAVGTTCWVMLPGGADWRWGPQGETTPLYESLRLFRSRQSGIWGPLLADTIEALDQWAAAHMLHN